MIRIIFESRQYYDAIYEVQRQLRDKLRHEDTDKFHADDILEWVSDLICEELNERNLKHYYTDMEE